MAVGEVPDARTARPGAASGQSSRDLKSGMPLGHNPGGKPMQTLRASIVALPFVGLALLVAVLSEIVGAGS